MPVINALKHTAEGRVADGDAPASDKQRNYIAALMDDLMWSAEQLSAYADEQRVDLVMMTKDQASAFIDDLKKLGGERAPLRSQLSLLPAPQPTRAERAARLGAARVVADELFEDAAPTPSRSPLPACTCVLCGLSRPPVRADVRLCIDCASDPAASHQRAQAEEDAVILHAAQLGILLDAFEKTMSPTVAAKYALWQELLRASRNRWSDPALTAKVEAARAWSLRPKATDDDRAFVALLDLEISHARAVERRVATAQHAYRVRAALDALAGAV